MLILQYKRNDMSLTEVEKNKIEEEEKYRHAVVASISQTNHSISQKHGVPLVLSIFIPGLGQIIKGQIKKGLFIMFAPIIGGIILLILGFINSNGGWVLGIFGQVMLAYSILYIWQLIDAYNN